MNIVVCIKAVPDPICKLEIEPSRKGIKRDGLSVVPNAYDLLALEQALRVKDVWPETRVTVLTVASSSTEQVLRECISAGADHAFLVCDPMLEGSDVFATAMTLAAAIRTLENDLVLCGSLATDGATGSVGALLAEVLGRPQVLDVVTMEVSRNCEKITAERRLERGDRQVVECPVPAVLTVGLGASDLRYPLLSFRRKAALADIRRLDLKGLGLSPDLVGLPGSSIEVATVTTPRPKTKRAAVPDSGLSAEERLQLLMAGGVSEKKGDLLEGSPEEMAAKVVEQLVAEKLLR